MTDNQNRTDTNQKPNIDQQYEPIPSFSSWGNLAVDMDRWNTLVDEIEVLKADLSKERFDDSIRFALRTAALDTGSIEGLYDTDRGFTYSVAVQSVTWEAEADERSKDLKRFFEAQLNAYELVIDYVAGQTPISAAFVRELHKELCKYQDTYRVLTSVGFREQPLPKGEYKRYANHVQQQDGSHFAYAPVNQTEQEMQRFIEELRSEAFEQAHPVLQAAYAHYAFVRIHPFADGNGRVSRAIASMYLYKAISIPLIIYLDQRDEYFQSLRQADMGVAKPFVDFVYVRAFEGMRIQKDQLSGRTGPSLAESLSTVNNTLALSNYQSLAFSLFEYLSNELERIGENVMSNAPLQVLIQKNNLVPKHQLSNGNFLQTPGKSNSLEIIIQSAITNHQVRALFHLVSQTQDGEHLVGLYGDNLAGVSISVHDLVPVQNHVASNKIKLWVDSLFGFLIKKLDTKIKGSDKLFY